MDSVHDFEIRDESTEDKLQYTLYCKGLPRARLEDGQGGLFVQQLVCGPMMVEEFGVYAHGLIELLLTTEGAANEYEIKKAKKRKNRRKKKRSRV